LQIWQDKISQAQKLADEFDGKEDQQIKVSDEEGINQKATKAIFDKVDRMRSAIESSSEDKRHKIFYLNSIYGMLSQYNRKRTSGVLQPGAAQILVDHFSKMLQADREGKSIAPLVKGIPYEIAAINTSLFSQNYGYREARTHLLRLYAKEHPEDFLHVLNRKYADLVDAPFVDSLVAQIARIYPVNVYNYATSYTVLGRKIRKNPDSLVQTIVEIGASPKAIRLLPFVDYIANGTYSVSELEEASSKEDAFYSLSVKTLMDMNKRVIDGEHPVGIKAIENNVTKRAMRYIRIVNGLHE